MDLSERAGAHVLANELHALAAIDLESLLEARLLVVRPVTAFWFWLSFQCTGRTTLFGLNKSFGLKLA